MLLSDDDAGGLFELGWVEERRGEGKREEKGREEKSIELEVIGVVLCFE